MPQALSNLSVGAKVVDTTSLYYGSPIVFKIVDKNHAGYPANSVTLISEKILCVKAFDAKEPSNSDSNRSLYGNNRYIYSNLRQWLNSEAAAWYVAQHSTDTPPITENVLSEYNPYASEPGFMTGLSANFKAAILSTSRTVAKNTVTDGGGTETVTDKIFIASVTEVGLSNEGSTEGTLLAGFSNDVSRVAYPTSEAVANSNYQNSNFNIGAGWVYWLSTPFYISSMGARLVTTTGSLNDNRAYVGTVGVRPLCNLNSEILVSDSPNTNGNYEFVWNTAPNIPVHFDGAWANSTPYVKQSGIWKPVTKAYVKQSGTWKQTV